MTTPIPNSAPKSGLFRRWFLIGGVLLPIVSIVTLYSLRAPLPAESKPLNVVLITVDTTRSDYLGCYGQSDVSTPHLDALAADGAQFLRCSSCSVMTLPSHASIMTGLYPFTHGVRRNATERLSEANQTLAEVLAENGYATHAVVASFVLNRQFGLAQGFDTYRDVQHTEGDRSAGDQRRGDEVCSDAIEALRRLSQNRFFLWVHFYDPHFPYVPTRPNLTEHAEAYRDEITFMDAQIGRLIHEISQLGIEKETLVVVVGDHGEGLDEHNEPEHGFGLYDTTVHVPLIFWCPGVIPASQAIAAQVRTIDVAPTILDLVGVPPIEDAQGIRLTPLMTNEEDDPGLTAYSEALEAHMLFELSGLRSLSADGWKYILAPKPELYHLDTDPHELHNRIGEQPERASEMHEQLQNLIAESRLPPSADLPDTDLTAADLARIEALGYTGQVSAHDESDVPELDRFAPDGKNPRDYSETLKLYTYAVRAKMSRRYAKMEQLFRRIVSDFPDAPNCVSELAYAIGKQGRFEEAIAMYERALAMESANDTPIRAGYGELLMRAKRWEEAIVQITHVVRKRPGDAINLHNLGLSYASIGQYAEAHRYLRQALEVDPDSIQVWRAEGIVHLWEGKLEQAAACFQKGLEINSSHPLLQNDLREVRRRMEQQ